jgi:hypothetical protein
MEKFLLALLAAIFSSAPEIWEAVRYGNGAAAKRKMREASDRVINAAIAKELLRTRKKAAKDAP